MRKLVILALFALAGCSAILGIEPGVHDPPLTDASTPEDDASTTALRDAKAPHDATPLVDANAPDPERPEAGACVDVENNPRHCGHCDHDCGTGSCKEGQCKPGVIVSGLEGPSLIAATANHVYYASDNGLLRRAPIFGGAAATLFDGGHAKGIENPFGHNLVIIGDYLYFADRPRNRVARCPLLGACTPETIIDNFPKAYALATANGDLYAGNGIAGTTVVLCKAPPCAQKTEVISGEDGLTLVATSATDIAWATINFTGKATIKTKPLAGGPTTTLLLDEHAGLLGTTSLVVTGRDVHAVFLSELIHFGLEPASKEMLGDVDATETLIRDWTSYWYGDWGGAKVYQRAIGTPRDAGSTLVADSASDDHLYSLALHESGVYWATDSQIWRLVR